MRAWAGSYTPQGRSQWALTFTLGANRRESMELSFLVIVFSGGTLLRGEAVFAGAPRGLGQKSGVRIGTRWRRSGRDVTGGGPGGAGCRSRERERASGLPLQVVGGDGSVDGAHALARGPAAGAATAAPVRPGDVVVLRHPFQQDLLIVKRAGGAARRAAGGCWVTTRSPAGTAGSSARCRTSCVLARARAGYRPPRRGSALGDRACWAGRSSAVRPRARGPLGLQALAGPVGRHVGAGRAAVRAVAAGAVGRGVEVGVAARRRLAEAEPVHARAW